MELEIANSDQVTLQTVKKFEAILAFLGRIVADAEITSKPKHFSKETVLKNSKGNSSSIILIVSGTLESLAEFREVVRADNSLGVTSRTVVWLFLEQTGFKFVPVFHRLQGRLAG